MSDARHAPDTPVAVLTTEPLDRLLDYLAPMGGVADGDFVEVPLGPRKVVGVVWGPGSGAFPREKLRRAHRVLDVAPMAPAMRSFLERAADYTMTPLSAMLRLATRTPGLLDPCPVEKVLRPGGVLPERMTPARRRVLEVLEEHGGLAFAPGDLARAAGVSPGVLRSMITAGALAEEEIPRDRPYPPLDPDCAAPVLSPTQDEAARKLCAGLASGGYGATLLKGVTGSGKTEVYLEAVADCLRRGRQALVLLPEIALGAEFVARVEARFGARPGEWHSGVTLSERRRLWRMVVQGGVQMVVGARSALFLPFANLGLVVVDEEHDTSYKQEDGVHYHARDMAVLRAALEGARVVLASATPALESWANAEAGKYERLDLPERYGTAQLPQMRAIDMRGADLPGTRWISNTLSEAVSERLAAGEQALLFLNRRGYAPVTICRACGHQIECPTCDARLVEHRFRGRLVCHQCGYSAPVPAACPACGAEGRLAPVGPGVERLAEEARALFPEARMAILSSDMAPSAEAARAVIARIAAGEADLIIGTQIVAKGHNFPLLTLVGVIDADLGLQGGDLRAGERTFQLVRQVAGRAGRAERPGLCLVQTHQPEHPVIRAILSNDEEAFWQAEAAARRAAGVPPYGRLAGIVLSGTDLGAVSAAAEGLARAAGPLVDAGAALFGPAPAPVARIRGRHRVRLLVKAARGVPLQAALARWVAQVKRPASVRLTIDIDPQSFY